MQPARALPHCSGPCDQGRAACTCATGCQPMPAEACTELGADTAPARAGALRRVVTHLRVALLRWHIVCLTAERDHYAGLGWVGPIYLRESYAQQRQLMSSIARLRAQQAVEPATRQPAWRRTVGTFLVALAGAVALVLAACGGGGSSEEPEPRPQVDCKAKPEQCK